MNKTCALIKELRIKSGLTAVQFSRVMGVSKASVSKWENDELPGINKLYEIARFFRVTVQELLNGTLDAGESDTRLEDSYDLSSFDIKKLIEDKNEEQLVAYYQKCHNILSVFLRLLPLLAYSKLTAEEIEEYKYLLKYVSFNEDIITYKHNYYLMYGRGIEPEQVLAINRFFESNKKLSKAEKEWEIRKIILFKPELRLSDLFKNNMVKPFIEAFKLLSQQGKDVLLTSILKQRTNKIYSFRDEFVFAMVNGGARVLKAEGPSTAEMWDEEIVKSYSGKITKMDVLQDKYYPLYGEVPDYTYLEYNEFIDGEYTSLLKEACQLRRSNPFEYYARLKSGKFDDLLNF